MYATEIVQNTTNILGYYVKHKFTLLDIKLYIYMQEDKFTSYKHYLLDFLFYRNTDQIKNTHTDQQTNAHTDQRSYRRLYYKFFLLFPN